MRTIGKDYLPPSNPYLGSSKDTLGTPGCGSLAPAVRYEGSQESWANAGPPWVSLAPEGDILYSLSWTPEQKLAVLVLVLVSAIASYRGTRQARGTRTREPLCGECHYRLHSGCSLAY